MVTTLSDLVNMIEQSTVPAWLREEIFAKIDQIDLALRNGGSVTLEGPEGQSIEISSANHVAHAA